MLTKKQRVHKLYKRTYLLLRRRRGLGTPCFVFGAQRSGTNMIMNVFKRSNLIECYDENDEEAFTNYTLKNYSIIESLTQKSPAQLIAFKPICDSQHAKLLLKKYPKAKSIWIYRHYNDVINSALRNWNNAARKNLEHMLYNPQKAGWRLENVTKEELELVDQYYNLPVNDASCRALFWYIRNRHLYKQNLQKHESLTIMNYERLVSEPTDYFKLLFNYLGVKFNPKLVSSVASTSIKKNIEPDINHDIKFLCDKLWENLEADFCHQFESTQQSALQPHDTFHRS